MRSSHTGETVIQETSHTPAALARCACRRRRRGRRITPCCTALPSASLDGRAAQVAAFYSWPAVALRTERVYATAMRAARDDSPLGRLPRYLGCGPVFGLLACMVAAFDIIFLHWLDWRQPASGIDTVPD